MSVTPNPVAPGQQVTVSNTFQHAKSGFVALLPGSASTQFAVEISDWQQYMSAHGMLASLAFNAATTVNATFAAPQQPGEYQFQSIVPLDGGTLSVDKFTVAAGAGAPAGAGAGGSGTGAGGPGASGGGMPSWLSGSKIIPGIPDVVVVGLPLVLLLMRR